MTDESVTVLVHQTWDVLVIRNHDRENGEFIADNGFGNYAEALLYAAQQADRYGVGITHAGGDAG